MADLKFSQEKLLAISDDHNTMKQLSIAAEELLLLHFQK